jgi:hypothetical protein
MKIWEEVVVAVVYFRYNYEICLEGFRKFTKIPSQYILRYDLFYDYYYWYYYYYW